MLLHSSIRDSSSCYYAFNYSIQLYRMLYEVADRLQSLSLYHETST